MMKKTGKTKIFKGICGVCAILALFLVFGCDDSDKPNAVEEPVIGKSTTVTAVVKASNGVLETATINTADGTGNATGSAVITLPEGTVATMADGTAADGDITFKITYNDGDSEATYPGGDFTVTLNGQQGELVTGGFVTVEATNSAGVAVASFSPSISANMILSGSFQQEAGAAKSETATYYEGDTIVVKANSLLEVVKNCDGVETSLGFKFVYANESGQLYVQFDIDASCVYVVKVGVVFPKPTTGSGSGSQSGSDSTI